MQNATTLTLPNEIPLMSVNTAATVLRRPLAQVQVMSRAHVLGDTFRAGDTPFYLSESIEELANATRHSRESILELVRTWDFPNNTVVILRQVDKAEREQQVTETANGPVRTLYYGFDRNLDLSDNPEEREDQNNASRMWWQIAPRWRDHVNAVAGTGGRIPVIITVGGLIVACREIAGFDHALTHHSGTETFWAFNFEPAREWATPLLNTWLESGPGRPILWWNADTQQ